MVPFRAGAIFRLNAPPHKVAYADFDVPDGFVQTGISQPVFAMSEVKESRPCAPTSMAIPEEKGIMHYARATPPPKDRDAPPGSCHPILVAEAGR